MKKPTRTKSSSRRGFLKKSALGVASAGFLGADLLHDPGKESQIEDKPTEDTEANMQAKPRHVRPVKGKEKERKVDRIIANDQDEVQWEAPTDSDIAIMFPPGRDPAGVETTVVKAGLQSRVFTITALSKTRQIYKYTVYCYATNEYAQGNSEPEMIVP